MDSAPTARRVNVLRREARSPESQDDSRTEPRTNAGWVSTDVSGLPPGARSKPERAIEETEMMRELRLRGPRRERLGTAERARTGPTLLTPVFIRVAAAELAYFTADGVLVPALPRFVAGPLGAGNVAAGLVIGAFSISAFFLRPWAGRAADRRGRRALMVTGASLFAVSVLGYLVVTSVPVLAALRLLTGAGEALFFVGAVSANMDLAPPERRGEAMSFASLSLYIGIGAGPSSARAVAWGGFTAAWVISIALGLVAVGLSLRLPPMRPEPSDGGAAPHRLVHPAGLLPGVILFAAIWGMGGFLAFAPLYVGDVGMAGAGGVLGCSPGSSWRSGASALGSRTGSGRRRRRASRSA
jgi:MFS family permease